MIQVDISNVWGQISLRDLLAMEKEVFAAHAALSEARETGEEYGISPETLSRLLEAARTIRSQSQVCVVVGMGGSCLGARGAIELLQGPNRNLIRGHKGDPQILFAGNSFSTRQWNELLGLLEDKDFSVILISGAGLEPAIAFRGLRWLLSRKYGTDEASRRIFAVTGGQAGALEQTAREEGWTCFSVPGEENRLGVLSPAGLLPMAAAGIDISALLSGAAGAREAYDLRSFENPAWLYAAVRNLMARGGMGMEVFAGCEPGFRRFAAWWQGLWGEQEGGTGLFLLPAAYTRDLYSLDRQFREGGGSLFETLVLFDPPQVPFSIGTDWRDLDELNYLEGKTLAYVQKQACQGILDAHTDAGIPVITVDCGPLTEETLGQLLCFLELSCALSAGIPGISPGDPGEASPWQRNLLTLLDKPGSETP